MRRIGALTLAILFKECKYWDANGDGTITEEEYPWNHEVTSLQTLLPESGL